MKKKLFILMSLALSALFLVACSNNAGGVQTTLDGEYYVEYDGEIFSSPWVVIEGKTLTYYSGGKDKPSGTVLYSIDTEKQTLTGGNEIQSYSFKDGVFSAKLGGNTSVEKYYSKNSEMYKKLKKD